MQIATIKFLNQTQTTKTSLNRAHQHNIKEELGRNKPMCGMKDLLNNLLIHRRKIKGNYGRRPFSLWLKVTVLPLLLGISSAVSHGQSIQTEPNCSHDKIICSWTGRVVGIKTPTMTASGFMLNKNTLVTNKHVVEDHTSVRVKFQSGFITKAEPIPNDHPADLVILNVFATEAKFENAIKLAPEQDQELRVVAYDQGRRGARIYAEGSYAIYPDWEKIRKLGYIRIFSPSQATVVAPF